MRPGERLHELLLREDERLEPCAHPGVLRVRDLAGASHHMADVLAAVARFEAIAAEGDEEGLRRALFAFVES
jgi:FlaA1/EpsC-like NDP-sugar epimerase